LPATIEAISERAYPIDDAVYDPLRKQDTKNAKEI
jgi:hypothetical protein